MTNPIFESAGEWDLLCDISTSRMVVSRDILVHHPPTAVATSGHTINRTATLKTEGSLGSEEDMMRPSKDLPLSEKRGEYKTDNDNYFMEDVSISTLINTSSLDVDNFQITSAILLHFGEAHVRAKIAEYAWRFVRMAARYEEDILGMDTAIGYPSSSFTDRSSDGPHLGSGMCFTDEGAGQRELAANASRIEAWRRTESYQLWHAVRVSGLCDCGVLLTETYYRISTRVLRRIPCKALTLSISSGDYATQSVCQTVKQSSLCGRYLRMSRPTIRSQRCVSRFGVNHGPDFVTSCCLYFHHITTVSSL